MRVREWYGWHFPELSRLVKDNFIYARCAQFIGDRAALTAEKLAGLVDIIGEEDEVREAAGGGGGGGGALSGE